LGREVVLTKEEELEVELSQDWNVTNTNPQQPQPKDSLKIRLWKLTSFPTSSSPYLESHFSQPSGSLKFDEIDSSDDYFQWSQGSYDYDTENESIDFTNTKQLPSQVEKIDFNCRQHFTVKWKVSYMLDIKANVRLHLPSLLLLLLPSPPSSPLLSSPSLFLPSLLSCDDSIALVINQWRS
jgi:hypothetical protein